MVAQKTAIYPTHPLVSGEVSFVFLSALTRLTLGRLLAMVNRLGCNPLITDSLLQLGVELNRARDCSHHDLPLPTAVRTSGVGQGAQVAADQPSGGEPAPDCNKKDGVLRIDLASSTCSPHDSSKLTYIIDSRVDSTIYAYITSVVSDIIYYPYLLATVESPVLFPVRINTFWVYISEGLGTQN